MTTQSLFRPFLLRYVSGVFLFGALINSVCAQDSRIVTEPTIPPICKTLIAQLATPDLDVNAQDTTRIQTAINQCPTGYAVQLSSDTHHHAFVAGPLKLHGGVTLLIDKNTTLYASTNPALYDTGRQQCGTNSDNNQGCQPFIEVNDSRHDGIMGQGAIDGQGGHVMQTKTETWWQLARRAQRENTIQSVPHLIVLNRANDFTMYRITLQNSLKFHVVLNDVDGFTAWGIKINTPSNARNTDGIDPFSSRNVSILYSYIQSGDDSVAIKSSNNKPSQYISILHNHFYGGHGMSIGSNTDGGIAHVLVDDLSMDGATSGLRIKSDISRGGLVQDIHFKNVCLRNVKAPFDLDTTYNPKAVGHLLPQYQDIYFEHIASLTEGDVIFNALDEHHPMSVFMSDVYLAGVTHTRINHATFTLQNNGINFVPTGKNVHIINDQLINKKATCDNCCNANNSSIFAPFPTDTITP